MAYACQLGLRWPSLCVVWCACIASGRRSAVVCKERGYALLGSVRQFNSKEWGVEVVWCGGVRYWGVSVVQWFVQSAGSSVE